MAAKLAAEEVKSLSRPQKAEEYKTELPKDFVIPQGVEFKIDESNPLWAQGKAWALKNGLSQEAFQEAVALVAGDRVGTQAQIDSARNAEIAKLGSTGPARVDAITTWANAFVGPDDAKLLASRLFTASDVKVWERIIAKVSGQGGASYSQSGREPPPGQGRWSDDQYAKASPGERIEYARSHSMRPN